MLLRNARLAGGQDRPTDVFIHDGEVAATGSAAAAASEADSESVDLDGRWMVPGLWDNHVHFTQWALWSRRLNLSAVTSARNAAAAVAEALADSRIADAAAPGTLVGVAFRDGLWPDTPTLADLDAASGTRPVVLISGDLHSAWLNSAALGVYGFSGHPTGLLREAAAFSVTGLVNDVPMATLDAWVADAADAAAARGVVGVVDYEMAWNLDDWVRRMAAGTRSLRVEFGVYTEHLDRAIALGLRTGASVNDLLTVGGFKVITDGSLNTRTAYCYDEYPGSEGAPNSRGQLNVPTDELRARMRQSSAAGMIPAVHAIGDHANTVVLDAFEALGISGRLEHAQLLGASDIARFAGLGIVASVQPEHAMDDRDVADRYWAGRTGRAFALRSLREAGATLALGSDAPVAPLDPWVTMAAAVGRTRDGRAPWHPEQAISFGDALAASTRTSIAPGNPADLAITDADPLDASPEALRSMPVSGTLLGGRWTHRAF